MQVVGDTAAYLSVLSFLRVIAESTVAVMVTLAVVDRRRGHVAAVPRRHRDHGAHLVRRRRACRRGTLGAQHSVAGRARGRADAVLAAARARPVRRLLIALTNAVTPGKGFRDGPFESESELRDLVDLARDSALIEAEEREMIHSVFELGDTLAREVMVPRTDMVVDRRRPRLRQAMTPVPALRASPGSRCVGEDVDDVVGLLYLKDVVAPAQRRPARPAPVPVDAS